MGDLCDETGIHLGLKVVVFLKDLLKFIQNLQINADELVFAYQFHDTEKDIVN